MSQQDRAEAAPLTSEELAEVQRQSEAQVHHAYIIPRLLATIAGFRAAEEQSQDSLAELLVVKADYKANDKALQTCAAELEASQSRVARLVAVAEAATVIRESWDRNYDLKGSALNHALDALQPGDLIPAPSSGEEKV